jgi:hypothetical protein
MRASLLIVVVILTLSGCVSHRNEPRALQEWLSTDSLKVSREVLIPVEAAIAFRKAYGMWPPTASALAEGEEGEKADFVARNVIIRGAGDDLELKVWDLSGMMHKIEIDQNERVVITPVAYGPLPPKGLMIRPETGLDVFLPLPIQIH